MGLISLTGLDRSLTLQFTALAGVMGKHYALKDGLPIEVAEAVFESVLPRNANDVLPKTEAGILVAVADRLDSLVGLVAAGCAPTGKGSFVRSLTEYDLPLLGSCN